MARASLTLMRHFVRAGKYDWRAVRRRDGEPLPAAREMVGCLAPTGPGYACVHRDEDEAAAAGGLQRRIPPWRGQAEVRAAFEAAVPLCLPHCCAVLREVQEEGGLDYQHSREPKSRADQGSWRRAVQALVGQAPGAVLDGCGRAPSRAARET